jgi:DHA1 family inner membrane transport protein
MRLETPYGIRLALIALGLGGFGIGIGEFAIMGLLPNVAADFTITPPEAGYAISAYALGVVIGAPVLTLFFARVPQRAMLIGLMAAFALANLASAAAGSLPLLVVERFLAGLPHGAYFGIASLVAAALVPPERQAQAIGRMMLGVSSSNVIGVPLITWLGQALSWRVAFTSVGLIGMATIMMIYRCVPVIPVKEGASARQEMRALTVPQVWLTLLSGAIGFGGMFAVYSYVAPTLLEAAHGTAETIPLVMALFGIGMMVGSTIGGALADRALHKALWALQLFNLILIGCFYFAGRNVYATAINIFLIGCGVAIVPALQMRLMELAKNAQSLVASLNHAALNIGNALGAYLGGLAIAFGMGWTSTGLVGVVLGIMGLIIFGFSMRPVATGEPGP